MGWNLGLEAGIWALRLGFGPQEGVFGLKAKIWVLRLGFGSRDIGHRLFWNRCSKKDKEKNLYLQKQNKTTKGRKNINDSSIIAG